jgi:pyruvate-ferredoxin/flavodoxin oxidoreductase
VAQWASSEGRFKKHFSKLASHEELISLEEILLKLTQNDIVHRNYLNPQHRSFIPLKGVYVDIVKENGKRQRFGVSRHLVLFTVERRKNWRNLQAKSGITNKDYLAQKTLLKKLDEGEIKDENLLEVYKQIVNTTEI